MKNSQKPDAFVFEARGCRYTCIRKTVLERLSNLDLEISIANETLPGWGQPAETIEEDLLVLGLDCAEYQYRSEAQFNTEQLQSLVYLYLSLEYSIPDKIARFI